ncbi:MAG TPA: fumarate hydratase C-terminal domain-containing protein [Alphaproteobacteria bacterium]|nr:fumarate hydratase C-terminal domain-containing protein [Alphaproteobacteria bacterium]
MKTVGLKLPVAADDLRQLEVGTVVYLDGVLYTGREGLYRRLIDQGQAPPVDLRSLSNANFHCSPAASVGNDGSYQVGAVTGTASFRFSHWLARWFEISDCRLIIGKGGMPLSDYRDHFVPRGTIYLTTVGYGTGALLGRGVKRVVDVYWLQELGVAQAMWVLEVENFGPFLVESDLAGNSLLEGASAGVNSRLEELYAGLKPPALGRYGETTSRDDEVI